MHKNWKEAGFLDGIKKLAEERSFSKLTINPVITWTNE